MRTRVLAGIDSLIETTGHPFGQRTGSVSHCHLGDIELGQVLHLQLTESGDRPFRRDETLLFLIDSEFLFHVMNVRERCDTFDQATGIAATGPKAMPTYELINQTSPNE